MPVCKYEFKKKKRNIIVEMNIIVMDSRGRILFYYNILRVRVEYNNTSLHSKNDYERSVIR